MKNLNVGKKLVVVFGIVLTLFISTAVVSGFCLIKVSSSMKNFYNNQFQTVSTQYSMRVSLQATIRYLLWACTTEVDAETDDYIAKAAEQVEIMKNGIPVLMEKFQGDITLVQNFKAQMDATAPIRENLIAMAQSNHVEESLKMFNEQYVPMVTEAQENLIQIGEYATNHSKEIYKVSQRLKTQAVSVLVTSVIASLLVIIYFCRYITKNITQPILEIERAATDLAHGKLDTDVTYESKDELGILSQSLRSTIKIMAAIIEDISYMTSELAKGNFTVTTKAESIYKGSYRPILTSMRSMKEHLSSTMLQIGQAAEQVSSGSDQVSSAAQSLSQGATEQSSTVEALSGTISEISEQVENNARHAETASAKATHVGNGIMENNRQMQQMMKAMEHINKSSGEIGKIIKTIEDIAFQTNILALNAAVEAARAGESGKGFAVVADEVRNLASKSAEASKNTSALIEHSIKAVEEGSQIADMTAKSLVETVAGVKEVTNSIREISAASAAQAESILLITQNMDQISSVVQTNSATAEESAAASEELAGQAKILKELVSIFQLDGASASSNSDIVQTHYHNAASVSPVTTNHLKY